MPESKLKDSGADMRCQRALGSRRKLRRGRDPNGARSNGPPCQLRFQDRDADVWEPLIAVADAVGGSWPDRARAAAVALVAESKEVESSLGIRLLADVRKVFGSADQMTSREIIRDLLDLEEAPWGDLKGKPLDERGLANRLRAYGVKSKTIRLGTATAKGYRREDLHDVWLRYLPSLPAKSATCVTSETRTTADTAHHVAHVTDVTDLPGYGSEFGHRCSVPPEWRDRWRRSCSATPRVYRGVEGRV